MTDSKRMTQESLSLEDGSRKSLRYQAVVPFMLASLWSAAFQAFGTCTAFFQPSVEVWRWKRCLSPTPLS